MGATRESSCSGGILEAGFCAEDAGACPGDDIYARMSPGNKATVQKITTRDRKVAPCRSGFMNLLSVPHGTVTNRRQVHRPDPHRVNNCRDRIVRKLTALKSHSTRCSFDSSSVKKCRSSFSPARRTMHPVTLSCRAGTFIRKSHD